MLATPALSFGTLAIALGLGANGETLAAIVYGAPPGADRIGLAWQVDVMLEDRGVREIKPNLPISVHAEWKGNARDWSGVTTYEGAAEVALDFGGVASGDEVALTVTADDKKKTPLAHALARVPEQAAARGRPLEGILPAHKNDGAIGLEVTIAGGALAAEFPCELWVRAHDAWGSRITGAQIHFDPAESLALSSNDATTDYDGWAKTTITATGLTASLTIHAKSGGIEGSWTGPLPVLLGATHAQLVQDDAGNLHVNVARPVVSTSDAYVEVDDESGRVLAKAVPLVNNGNDFARAVIDLPKLSARDYWIVAASSPRAAESMPSGAFAILFRVDDQLRAFTTGELASYHARGFARTVVADGFSDARNVSEQRRHRAMSIAFAALALGGIIETLLLLRAARIGSRANDDARSSASWLTKTPATVAIGVGLSLLGFALLAAFVATR
jgi:hypothetical protein